MKILYVINSSDFFCSHFFHVAHSAKRLGNEVIIVCGDENKKEFIIDNGFEFLSLDMNRCDMSLIANLKSMLTLYMILKRKKPEVVHLLTIKPIIFGGVLIRLFFSKEIKKTITSITGLGSLFLDSSIKNKLLWLGVENLYKFVMNSKKNICVFENDDDLNLFISNNICKRNNSTIINGAGVDTKEFSPREYQKNDKIISLVCRIIKDKGVLEFIEAGRILKEREINVTLQLIGDFDLDNISKIDRETINNANKNGYIKYLGKKNNISEIYRESYAACLPSYREGLSKSLIEAMSCGLPIITTNVPGCRQLTRFNNGIIVQPKDPLDLANSIQYLINNKKLAISMGLNSRIAAEKKFDNKIIESEFYELYIG